MIWGQPGIAATIAVQAGDNNAGLYGSAIIYNNSGVVTTITLSHVGDGVYVGSWTPANAGTYQVVGKFFTDAGRTSLAPYQISAETMEVDAFRQNILRTLGLSYENSVVDNQSYDGNGNLTGARIRCYDTAANATSAGSTGVTFQYTVTATYAGTALNKYSIIRVL
jgi:hypothetical protein